LCQRSTWRLPTRAVTTGIRRMRASSALPRTVELSDLFGRRTVPRFPALRSALCGSTPAGRTPLSCRMRIREHPRMNVGRAPSIQFRLRCPAELSKIDGTFPLRQRRRGAGCLSKRSVTTDRKRAFC
jgi:hypothetical protein